VCRGEVPSTSSAKTSSTSTGKGKTSSKKAGNSIPPPTTTTKRSPSTGSTTSSTKAATNSTKAAATSSKATSAPSMCVWSFNDYGNYGTGNFPPQDPSQPDIKFKWDGYFYRGYGRSRCIPLVTKCGDPGQPCCPSMLDQRLSGMVHNRNYTHQPCNYRSVGRKGVYCKGAWQGDLLNPGVQPGVCTPNKPDCGAAPGKACCVQVIPEIGSVGQCMSSTPPGTYYCTKGDNICTACPKNISKAATKYEAQNCQPYF
jgi:hypothetical protein